MVAIRDRGHPQRVRHATRGRPTIARPVTAPFPVHGLDARPRGPLSAAVLEALATDPGTAPAPVEVTSDDPLVDEDLQLALYCCYELHYRGIPGVAAGWEWDPGLLALRARMERVFESGLRAEVGELVPTGDITAWLQSLLVEDEGPSTSSWCAEQGTYEQVCEEAVHRSLFQRKEADPHSWLFPRLDGPAKAALVEIQADEYGHGVLEDIHHELFGTTMERLGLDRTYNAYVDLVPATGLATVNIISMFALHRRLLGAAVGHLALFEMASVPVMADHDAALRRLGFDDWTRLFYTTHVVADAHHQTIAGTKLAGGLVAADPAQETEVMFGAAALAALEARTTEHLLGAWSAGRTALRRPLDLSDRPPGRHEQRPPADDPRRRC